MAENGESNGNGNGNGGRVTTAQLYEAILGVNERMDRKFEVLSREIKEITRVEPPRLVQHVNVIERDLEKETRLRKEEDDCLQAGVNNANKEIVDLKLASSRGDKIIASVNAALVVIGGIISAALGSK